MTRWLTVLVYTGLRAAARTDRQMDGWMDGCLMGTEQTKCTLYNTVYTAKMRKKHQYDKNRLPAVLYYIPAM